METLLPVSVCRMGSSDRIIQWPNTHSRFSHFYTHTHIRAARSQGRLGAGARSVLQPWSAAAHTCYVHVVQIKVMLVGHACVHVLQVWCHSSRTVTQRASDVTRPRDQVCMALGSTRRICRASSNDFMLNFVGSNVNEFVWKLFIYLKTKCALHIALRIISVQYFPFPITRTLCIYFVLKCVVRDSDYFYSQKHFDILTITQF